MQFLSRRLGLLALIALSPSFALGALFYIAPNSSLATTLYRPLLVVCGPAVPCAVILGLMGIASEDKKRAALALGLLLPAIAFTLTGASRAHVEAEVRRYPPVKK